MMEGLNLHYEISNDYDGKTHAYRTTVLISPHQANPNREANF